MQTQDGRSLRRKSNRWRSRVRSDRSIFGGERFAANGRSRVSRESRGSRVKAAARMKYSPNKTRSINVYGSQ